MDQQVAESLSVDVKTTAPSTEPEPHLDAFSPTDDLNKSKKKKKKKNRRKNLEKNEVENMKEELKTKEKEEASIEEMAVSTEALNMKTVVTEGDKQDKKATDDEIGPQSLELTSSLDTIKASGTRAMGSLLSRFKVGRKTPLLSETESVTKLEMVNSSPVESTGKRLEVPEEKILDMLMRTKKGLVGEEGQIVQVSAEKDKYDVLEEQRKEEKTAMQTLPSSAKSRDGVQKQVEADDEESEVVDSLVHLSSTDTAESDGQELAGNTGADSKVDVLSKDVTDNMVKVDATAIPATVDENGSAVTAVETLKHDTLTTLETNGSTDEQVITMEVQDENVSAPAETKIDALTEKSERSADAVMIEPVSLKLGLDIDADQSTVMTQKQLEAEVTKDASLQSDEAPVETIVTKTVEVVEAIASSDNDQSEVVAVEPLVDQIVDATALNEPAQNKSAITDESVAESSVSESVRAVASNEYSQGQAISTSKTELLAVKITPPTSGLLGEAAAPVKPEKMSPVKSLASRFEGKREQSLDSLKFRTVREFFPEERSIRVGAEKKKYEAQAQQQKLKAKAEEEAKAKYKAGSCFKSPEKEKAAPSLQLKNSASIVQESVVTGGNSADPVDFTTPDAAASRKKFSFDEGCAAINSPSKSSDDAQESLTPVKSIASRFEGKHEQSLDNLKFRTVREFFPDEGKRSVHVGAEKAKYEALRKQQEEATKTAEQVRPKHTAFSLTSTNVKHESSVEVSSIDASVKTSLSTLDEACNEMTTSATLSSSETKDGAVVESADDSVESVAVGGLSVDSEAGASVKANSEESYILTDTASITVIKEDKLAASGVQGQAEEMMDAAVAEPVPVGSDNIESTVAASEETKFDQEAGKAVSGYDTRLVELDLAEGNRRADVDTVVDSHASTHVSLNIDPNAKSEEVQDIEPKIDSGLEKISLEEGVINKSAEFNGGVVKESAVGEQVDILQTLNSQNPVQVAEEKTANSKLVELDLGRPVTGVQDDSSVFPPSKVSITDGENESVGIQQAANNKEASTESRGQVPVSASSAENELMGLDLGESADVESLKEQMNNETKKNAQPMLTTERSFVMKNDHTIETVETVVVGERPMTDGEDDFELLSPTKVHPAHEVYSGITSSKSKKSSTTNTSAKTSPKVTRKVSAVSVGSVKSTSAKPTVPIPAKSVSITATTASCITKKALEAKESHKTSPQIRKKRSASKLKGKVSDTGFIKPPPAAPTVPVPMKGASIIARTSSWQARNVSDYTGEVSHSRLASTTPVSKFKSTAGPTSCVKPTPPPPTVPVAPKRASIMAPTASYKAKKAAEHVEDIGVAVPSVPARNKKYMNVKSKVLAGIQSGLMQTVAHKTITKEEFIAAERRKSLGSAGVRSVLGAIDRRASLSARTTIDGPPEPFVRSALSRKKLSSTLPRYMNYENTSGYAERARQQYERRKRLEEENAAKSEKRQRELRTFFADKQHKSLMSSADEVRRGLEAHELAKLAKESENAEQKALRTERQRTRPTRSYRRAPSATSSAGASSSNDAPSRTSKKSSVSSVAEKIVAAPALEATVESEEMTESTLVTEETVKMTLEEIATETQEAVVEVAQADKQMIPDPVVVEDLTLEQVVKKIDFDEASSDSGESVNVSNE